MNRAVVHKETFDFLRAIHKHNDREWFNSHRADYELAYGNMADLADVILSELNTHDTLATPNGKKALFRIYRDVRFSKDKTPYTTWISASFMRATVLRRGSYYLRIQPNGHSVIGGGFWGPNKEDLSHIRMQISADAEPLRKVLKSKSFKDNFGLLKGESLKTHPRGFDPEDSELDLLRMKNFLVMKSFSDNEVLSPDFIKEINKGFKSMRPFLDVMTMYLTTDMNGELRADLEQK